jgi:hypothetical protein
LQKTTYLECQNSKELAKKAGKTPQKKVLPAFAFKYDFKCSF